MSCVPSSSFIPRHFNDRMDALIAKACQDTNSRPFKKRKTAVTSPSPTNNDDCCYWLSKLDPSYPYHVIDSFQFSLQDLDMRRGGVKHLNMKFQIEQMDIIPPSSVTFELDVKLYARKSFFNRHERYQRGVYGITRINKDLVVYIVESNCQKELVMMNLSVDDNDDDDVNNVNNNPRHPRYALSTDVQYTVVFSSRCNPQPFFHVTHISTKHHMDLHFTIHKEGCNMNMNMQYLPTTPTTPNTITYIDQSDRESLYSSFSSSPQHSNHNQSQHQLQTLQSYHAKQASIAGQLMQQMNQQIYFDTQNTNHSSWLTTNTSSSSSSDLVIWYHSFCNLLVDINRFMHADIDSQMFRHFQSTFFQHHPLCY